jgi:hypothetical protein
VFWEAAMKDEVNNVGQCHMCGSISSDSEAFDAPHEELASNRVQHLTYPKPGESQDSDARVVLTWPTI